jgi:hypothetical protein
MQDTLVCFAVLVADAVLLKTIMVDWQQRPLSWRSSTTKRTTSCSWIFNIGDTVDDIGESTILDVQKSGMYLLQIERVPSGAA